MERRKAITAAAAVSLTLLAGAAGMALSSNIVGAGVNDDVGQLSPVSSATDPAVTVHVDDQSDLTSTLATAPPAQEYDDEYDDDEYDDDDEHDDDEHEDHERAEYEGRDDDD